jgi:ABC-type uncharacterized transport system involved in gliding motility auxiliary subunit
MRWLIQQNKKQNKRQTEESACAFGKSNRKTSLALSVISLGLVTLSLVSCSHRPAERSAPPTVRPVELPGTSAAKPASPSAIASNKPNNSKAPIADRPINVAGNCSQTEEDGFRESAQVQIDNNEVRALTWKIWVGKKGQCSFEGTEFSQSQSRPHIELQAKDGSGCKLMIWQTPQRVTLAHADCQKRCTAGVYDDAWPVMFHPQTGACARVG